MKILAVDDDHDFLTYLDMVLRELGYGNLTLVASAEEALKHIALTPVDFDCFILDIRMPCMDGIELCGRIRAMPQHRDTPIVMATAMSDRDHIDRAFSAGATDYLTKPLDKLETRARLGVVQQLARERLRANYAVAHSGHDVGAAQSCGFMDSLQLKRVDGAIDILAMGNYLKTLGFFRAGSICSIGVQVTNARNIYDLEGGKVFSEIMMDVAHCLSDSLQERHRMLSYAGGGTFVAVGPRSEFVSADKFSARLNSFVSEFEAVYHDLSIMMPNVMVGSAIGFRIGRFRSPERLVDETIASVRNQTTRMSLSA